MDEWLKIGWYQKHQIEALFKNFSVNLFGLLEATTGGVFCKKGILRNFAKFTGKHLRQSLFFNKVAGGASWETTSGRLFLYHIQDLSYNHIETIQLICNVIQLINSYISGILLLIRLKSYNVFYASDIVVKSIGPNFFQVQNYFIALPSGARQMSFPFLNGQTVLRLSFVNKMSFIIWNFPRWS